MNEVEGECNSVNEETQVTLLKSSGILSKFVVEQKGSWNHSDWEGLLKRLREQNFTIAAEMIGAFLEEEKKLFWEKQSVPAANALPATTATVVSAPSEDVLPVPPVPPANVLPELPAPPAREEDAAAVTQLQAEVSAVALSEKREQPKVALEKNDDFDRMSKKERRKYMRMWLVEKIVERREEE